MQNSTATATVPAKKPKQQFSVTCPHCGRTQFTPPEENCKICHEPLTVKGEGPIDLTIATGLAILYFRRKKNMSQRIVAKRMDVHHHYISKVERGKVGLTLRTFRNFAEALGVHHSTLMSKIDDLMYIKKPVQPAR